MQLQLIKVQNTYILHGLRLHLTFPTAQSAFDFVAVRFPNETINIDIK